VDDGDRKVDKPHATSDSIVSIGLVRRVFSTVSSPRHRPRR
jgi:hypothetical protein